MKGPRNFVQEEYDKYDAKAKRLLVDHLIEKGHSIVNSDEDYYHDIVSSKDGVDYFFEVEVKLNRPFSSMRDFPYDTVSFTGRKLRLHNKKPFFYVIFCLETSTCLYCHSNIIYNKKYAEDVYIDSKNRKGMDKLYRVPKEKCKFVKLMVKKTLGMIKKTVYINKIPCDFHLPLMNPEYLTQNNLWDTND